MCTRDYYVTILNDASLTDGYGAIHTWLIIGCAGASPTYFSFSNTDSPSLVGID